MRRKIIIWKTVMGGWKLKPFKELNLQNISGATLSLWGHFVHEGFVCFAKLAHDWHFPQRLFIYYLFVFLLKISYQQTESVLPFGLFGMCTISEGVYTILDQNKTIWSCYYFEVIILSGFQSRFSSMWQQQWVKYSKSAHVKNYEWPSLKENNTSNEKWW